VRLSKSVFTLTKEVEMSTQTAESPGTRVRDIPQEVLNRGREMAGFGRDIWLALLGAVATMDEEGTEISDRLVERGKQVEAERRKRISARREKVAQALEENPHDPLVSALKRVGVSTHEEIRDLTARVESLAHKVDRLVTKPTGAEAEAEADGAAAGGEVRVFNMVAREDGWVVDREGRQRALSMHPTKDEALERAREIAHRNPPGRLDVYKKDGTMQESFSYAG
jgi:polyhydroxyalkanoate synthesis regulator phasin